MTKPDFEGELFFQADDVPRSLETTGKLYADVDEETGGFATWIGDHQITVKVPIFNARDQNMTIDQNGFELVQHDLNDFDFYNEEQILKEYYPAVNEFMKKKLGAHEVFTYDHVVRNSGVSSKNVVKSGQKIGGPARKVHGDYAMNGGIIRVQRLALPPSAGDSFRSINGDKPLISPAKMEELKGRRFAIINLWRSFTDEPCVDMPLAFCDTKTMKKEDIVTMETRYSAVMIDTYLAGHTPDQKWYYYPELLKTEGVLLKTYDTQGELFSEFPDYSYRIDGESLVPATLTLHSAVPDPRLEGKEYPKRQSIEIRAVVFY
mmetsp:Transcript_63381/g.95667  ORF Transcript_63381/g.95667 Transcript_63381/m.95667 type:complete len:319 (+) Transcript_63381:25-981(+)